MKSCQEVGELKRKRHSVDDYYPKAPKYAAGGEMDRIDWSRNEYRQKRGVPGFLIILIIIAVIAGTSVSRQKKEEQQPSPDAVVAELIVSDIKCNQEADGTILVTGNISATITSFGAHIKLIAFTDQTLEEAFYSDDYYIGVLNPGEKKPFSFTITTEIGEQYHAVVDAINAGRTRITAHASKMTTEGKSS